MIRMLVVDDDPLTADATTRALMREFTEGVPPVVAASVKEALPLVTAKFPDDASRFDCVLTDGNLPDGHGHDIVLACLAHSIPVVLYTGDYYDPRVSDVLGFGVEVMRKGETSFGEIVAALRRAMERDPE